MKKRLRKKLRKFHWKVLGTILGYPKCCIKSFSTENYRTRGTRKLSGTGYVPCRMCNLKDESDLVDTINKNRYIDTKFPDDSELEIMFEAQLPAFVLKVKFAL